MKISIAIPIFNEEETIPELYKRINLSLKRDFKKWRYEIIFVDDGSSDKSFDLLTSLRKKDKDVKIIQFSRNFGHHIALTAALDHATGDIVVMMDGDLQDKPEEIINLYQKLGKGFDVVYAERENKRFGIVKRFTSYIFNKLIKLLVNEDIAINSTIFRVMTKQVADSIKLVKENNRYLIGIIGWVGFKTTSQKVKHDRRFAGKTKYSLSKQIDLALNAIFSFSNYPIRVATRIGVLVVAGSVALAIFALARKLIFGTAFVGWTSMLITVLFIGGFQIILIGLIGEYIGRTYIETKKRPLYIVRKKLI